MPQVQQNPQQERGARQEPQGATQKPELSEKVKKEIATVLEKMPEALEDLGTPRDQALQHLKAQYTELLEKHTPDIKEQMDLLHARASASGSFDPSAYAKLMKEFRDRSEKEGVGILPQPLEQVRARILKVEADARPDSAARKKMMEIDADNFENTFRASMRQQYTELTTELANAATRLEPSGK